MTTQQLAHHMPEGAGKLFVTQVTDINGNALNPAPRFELSLMKIGFENVREQKTQNGKYAVPLDIVTGKSSPKIKGEMFNYDIEQINAMFYGQDVIVGADLTQSDMFTVPANMAATHKIKNCVAFFLGRQTSHTSTKIANAAAAAADVYYAPPAGKFGTYQGKYYFNKADIGKTAEVTWVCVGGVSVVSTFKIPAARNGQVTFDINGFVATVSLKRDTVTYTLNSYNAISEEPPPLPISNNHLAGFIFLTPPQPGRSPSPIKLMALWCHQ